MRGLASILPFVELSVALKDGFFELGVGVLDLQAVEPAAILADKL